MKKHLASLCALALAGCQTTTVSLPQNASAYERPAPRTFHGAPGSAAYVEVMREINAYYFHGVPVRLEAGTYTSAGTMWLFVVEHVPGSCISRDTTWRLHGVVDPALTFFSPVPVRATGEARRIGDHAIGEAYNPSLRADFEQNVASSDSGQFHTRTGATMIDVHGYREC